MTGILDYFDRLAVIHLPERKDRLRALRRELSRIGIEISHPKVCIPEPPMPGSAHGFPSRGIFGNFLSHLEIVERAYADGLATVCVLEDDAIFCKQFRKEQADLVLHLRNNPWDLLYLGYSSPRPIPASPTFLVRYSGPFLWAHAYAVHRHIMPRWIEYMRAAIEREGGHPDGGKLYVDAAQFLFRQLNPDAICIVSSPCFSVQRGSPSSLNAQKWFQRFPLNIPIGACRGLRDEAWRQGWLRIDGPQLDVGPEIKINSGPPECWPL